jgi:hypothetical protein
LKHSSRRLGPDLFNRSKEGFPVRATPASAHPALRKSEENA